MAFGSLLVVLAGLSVSTSSFAQPLNSNNPDDYDVAKYEQLLQEANIALQNARIRLDDYNRALGRANEKLGFERGKFDAIGAQIEANAQTMANAEARIRQLQATITNAAIEQGRLQDANRALETELARAADNRARAQAEVARTSRLAEGADAALAVREAEVAPLRVVTEQARQGTAQAKEQLAAVRKKLGLLEGQKKGTQTRIATLQTTSAKLSGQIREKQATIPQLEKEIADKKAKHDTEGQKRAEQNLANAKSEIARLESELSNISSELADAQKTLEDLTKQAQSAATEVALAQKTVNTKINEEARAENILQNALRDLTLLRNQANEAHVAIDRAQSFLRDTDQRIQNIQTQIIANQNRQRELNELIAASGLEIRNQELAIRDVRTQIPILTANAEYQGRIVRQAEGEVAQLARDRQACLNVIQLREVEVAFLSPRLQQVRRNLEEGKQIAISEGTIDGQADGAERGRIEGDKQGRQNGADVGARDGKNQGTQAGIAKVQAKAREEGSALGSREGTEKGTRDGSSRGGSEGQTTGNTDGLAAGFEAGRIEGDKLGCSEGTAKGHTLGGSEKGRTDGIAQGSRRGTTEGTAQGSVDGQRQADDEFLGTPLANVTIPNRSLEAKSKNFDGPIWDDYNPHRTYPHPWIQQAYEDSYRQNFTNSAGSVFDQVYKEVYAHFYDETYGRVYADYVNRDYPAEYRTAYDQARSNASDTAYKENYNKAYAQSYRPAYDEAYRASYPTRQEEGKKTGYDTAFPRCRDEAYGQDYERAKSNADASSYREAFATAQAQGKKNAYDARAAYYANNAVLKYESSLLVDANDDGVFAPGEAISVAVVMKNFGKQSQAGNVWVTVEEPSNGIIVDRGKEILAKIPGVSRTTVTDVVHVRVSPIAEVGKTEKLTVRVQAAGGEILGETTLRFTVAYPYTVASAAFPNLAIPGTENKVVVTVKNVSTKRSSNDVTVSLVSLDSLARITGESVTLGTLESNESKNASLAFTFDDENAYKALRFEVQIFEGKWLLGKRQFTVQSGKQWAYNPSSRGLIVIGSNAQVRLAEQVEEASGLAYDLWNLSIDGELTSDVELRYLEQSLVILSASTLNAGGDFARIVDEYLSRGGRLFVGNSAGYASSSLRDVVERFVKRFEPNVFEQVQITQGNFFSPNVDARNIVIVGPDVLASSATSFGEILVRVDLIARGMAEKVNTYLRYLNSGQKNRVDSARALILRELRKEMFDDKEIDGSNFKNNVSNLRLTAFINTTLAKTGADRKALLRFYSDLNEYRKDVGWIFSSRRSQIEDVLEPLKNAFDSEIGE